MRKLRKYIRHVLIESLRMGEDLMILNHPKDKNKVFLLVDADYLDDVACCCIHDPHSSLRTQEKTRRAAQGPRLDPYPYHCSLLSMIFYGFQESSHRY